jgi:hypothetical protein
MCLHDFFTCFDSKKRIEQFLFLCTPDVSMNWAHLFMYIVMVAIKMTKFAPLLNQHKIYGK